MLQANIFGAYDTRDLANLFVAPTAGPNRVTIQSVLEDMRQWATYLEDIARLYLELIVDETEDAEGRMEFGSGGGEMQPYREYGAVEDTRTEESGWEFGLPLKRYRDQQAYTEEYLTSNNLGQIQKDTIAAGNRYVTTRILLVIRALVGHLNYTFNEAGLPGMVAGTTPARAVKRLMNADGIPGSIRIGNSIVQIGTLQSYVPSGSATLTKAQFVLNRTKLKERGFTGYVRHVISPLDVETVRAMAGFTPRVEANPYIRVVNDTTPQEQAVVRMTEAIGVFGDGLGADGEVVVLPFWPQGYVYSYDATKQKPVRLRNHRMPQFQGFKLVQNDTGAAYGDGDLRNKVWEFIQGAGVANRMNGVVSQATTGVYVPPSVISG